MKQILKIDTDYGTITLSSESKYSQNNITQIDNLSLNNVPIQYNHTQTIPIIFNKANEFANICLLEELRYDISFETTHKDIQAFKTLKNFKDDSPLTIMEFEDNYKGYLQFSSYVGKTFLDIYKNEECVFSLPIEIQSRKLNYNKHYPQMIGDLSKYSSGIIFELNSPIYQEFILENENQSPYEKFMLLEYILREEHLPSIVEYLSRNLYSTLENVEEEVPISFAANINPDDLIDAILDSEELYNNIPLRVNETKYEDTIDVAENRFYKHFLEQISNLIEELLTKIDEGYVYDKLKTYEKELDYYLSQKYFRDISRLDYIPLNSQVLQKKEGYRDLLSYYLMFEFGFKLNWKDLSDKFKGHEKKLYELYEYWCYFKLIEIMNELCQTKVNFEDIFKISDDGLSIELREGIFKRFNYNGIDIDLLYNKTFNRFGDDYKTYSVELRPDYTLKIYGDEIYFIHFDAKYKMYVDSETFKNEDIVKMHAYKDAIKNTIGAYVLYPGSNDRLYYEDYGKVESVGGFGLIPGEEKIERIKRFIENILSQKSN
ncbi:DUF2357 domain-containing protein [Methanobrevibacter sp.]|uniref:DUF2357 domain-containing protein n=1 Tax=Methanobrevibacter sp. TaxID=66852 RepID=UPI00386DC1A1